MLAVFGAVSGEGGLGCQASKKLVKSKSKIRKISLLSWQMVRVNETQDKICIQIVNCAITDLKKSTCKIFKTIELKMLVLKEPFKTAWANKDPFEEVLKLNGEIYREVATRRTLNFKFQGESFYIKVHKGTTVKEILKNYLSLRAPVLGAGNEYKAINRLTELGVNTMEVVAFGERGVNPLTRESFIITKDLNPAISLEDYCKAWKDTHPSYHVKKVLIEEVARMVKTMHEGGVNHRDCYICHFLLHLPYSEQDVPKLSVIDLHRAQIRRKVPVRWRDKDLVALYFSSQHLGLTFRDYCRFLRIYFNCSNVKEIGHRERRLLSSVREKSRKIEERTVRKGL